MTSPLTFVVDIWDPRRGGLESYADTLARGLAAQGFPVAVFTGRVANGVSPPGPVTVTGSKGRAFYRDVDAAHAAGRLGRPLSFRHPGAVGGVFLPLGGLFSVTLQARRAAEPMWLRGPRRLARALSPKTRTFLARERAFFAAHDAADTLVIAPSPRVAAQIARRFPDYPGQVHATGLPIDLQRFRTPAIEDRNAARARLGIVGDAPVLLWLGNDPVRKGLDLAVATAQQLRVDEPATRLLAAGRGDARRYAHDVLTWLGPRDDVESLLHAADVLLLPTFEDSFGLVVAEALATGLPVVTTRAAGAAEWLAGGVSLGLAVADPTDVDALVRGCRMALRAGLDDTLRSERREAVEGLSIERHLEQVVGLLG